MANRVVNITKEDFRALLSAKAIRPASLEDVYGTHHKRPLYRHPNTNDYYVEVTNGPSIHRTSGK
jgi:hypothetical protein